MDRRLAAQLGNRNNVHALKEQAARSNDEQERINAAQKDMIELMKKHKVGVSIIRTEVVNPRGEMAVQYSWEFLPVDEKYFDEMGFNQKVVV